MVKPCMFSGLVAAPLFVMLCLMAGMLDRAKVSRDFWQCRYVQVVATSNVPTDCGVDP